jgi:hypothetical protein
MLQLTLQQKGEMCMGRVKIFAIIALLGFVAGVIAQVTMIYFVPWLISVLPLLGGLTSFMVSGVAGAVLTVAIVSVWAYMTGNKDSY